MAPNGPFPAATRLIAALLAWAGWGCLTWWALGRLLGDRWLWTQWMAWTPTLAIVGVSGLCFLAAWAAGKARVQENPRSRPKKLNLTVGAWLALVLWHLGFEARLWVIPARTAFGQVQADLTILCWNANGAGGEDLVQATRTQRADLVILTNPPPGTDWGLIIDAVGSETSSAGLGRTRVLSTFPIITYGGTSLGLKGRVTTARDQTRWHDSGWAGFIELDTTQAVGRRIVIWVVDLPSDLSIPRGEMVSDAALAIREWNGPILHHSGELPTSSVDPGFPDPDIVIGDFNTPRGSRSLGQLTHGLSNAWTDAGLGGGCGLTGSWPRTRPIFHIDQTFLSPALRSASYRLLDLSAGSHKAQLVGVSALD